MMRLLSGLSWALIVGMLGACAQRPLGPDPAAGHRAMPAPPRALEASDGTPLSRPVGRWVAVGWDQLPGWNDDALHEAWNAWLRSCERPAPAWTGLCPQIRRLSIADDATRRDWLQAQLQPYRVESAQGEAEGLLTAYYEPMLEAARRPDARFQTPLYRAPAGLGQRKPWYSRQEMETLPEARQALAGAELLWLADPLDALVLQIQGSGRLRVSEADGRQRWVRLAFAGSNEQPYRSVGRWLLEQGALRDATWPGIKAWARQNPQRLQELLWSNPRVVFFREEALTEIEPDGPTGAQGVALTAQRSIAVDPGSIPYGTPVWLASGGPTPLQRLVLAQDTGSAITGAVRADFYAGAGDAAGEWAGRMRQNLRLWVLWPAR